MGGIGQAVLIAALGICIPATLVATSHRWLYRWYLRAVRRIKVAADPAEAIITYPLA